MGFYYGSMTYVLLWEHLTLKFKMGHALNMEGHNFEKEETVENLWSSHARAKRKKQAD